MAENQGLSQWRNEYLKNFKISEKNKHESKYVLTMRMESFWIF